MPPALARAVDTGPRVVCACYACGIRLHLCPEAGQQLVPDLGGAAAPCRWGRGAPAPCWPRTTARATGITWSGPKARCGSCRRRRLMTLGPPSPGGSRSSAAATTVRGLGGWWGGGGCVGARLLPTVVAVWGTAGQGTGERGKGQGVWGAAWLGWAGRHDEPAGRWAHTTVSTGWGLLRLLVKPLAPHRREGAHRAGGVEAAAGVRGRGEGPLSPTPRRPQTTLWAGPASGTCPHIPTSPPTLHPRPPLLSQRPPPTRYLLMATTRACADYWVGKHGRGD